MREHTPVSMATSVVVTTEDESSDAPICLQSEAWCKLVKVGLDVGSAAKIVADLSKAIREVVDGAPE